MDQDCTSRCYPAHMLKNRPFHRRLGFATRGIVEVFARERSFRSQTGLAVMITVALVALHAPLPWCALIVAMIGQVLALEAVNASLEYLADHLHPGYAAEVGRAKDASAGAVLIASITALLVAGLMAAALL